jgi:hypothetical protein
MHITIYLNHTRLYNDNTIMASHIYIILTRSTASIVNCGSNTDKSGLTEISGLLDADSDIFGLIVVNMDAVTSGFTDTNKSELFVGADISGFIILDMERFLISLLASSLY